VINLGDSEAELCYVEQRLHGVQCWDLWHTEVPVNHRGKGIAEHLAEEVMRYVTVKGLKVTLSCWYLRDYFLPQHPEFKAQLAD